MPHPAILHLHIHLLEMSAMPERGMRSADLLGKMCPDAGHMNHMPGHIHVLCGDYEKARIASEKAVRANDLYLAYTDAPSYYLLGCCHDLHLMMFACMFLGQSKPALWAADKVRSLVTRDVVALPDRPKLTQTVEGYHAMKSHVLVRFGRWQEIIDEPMTDDPTLYVMTTAMQHYAKGVAYATLRNFAEADRQRDLFNAHVDRIPVERRFLSNPARASWRSGRHCWTANSPITRARMTRRMRICGAPSSWTTICPTPNPGPGCIRPACAGRVAAGSGSCRGGRAGLSRRSRPQRQCAALRPTPEQCLGAAWTGGMLARRGETQEMPTVKAKLAAARAKADVEISSSCLCRTSAQSVQSCCH